MKNLENPTEIQEIIERKREKKQGIGGLLTGKEKVIKEKVKKEKPPKEKPPKEKLPIVLLPWQEVLVVFLFVLVSGLLVFGTYCFTKEPRKEQKKLVKIEEYQHVFAEGKNFEKLDKNYTGINEYFQTKGYGNVRLKEWILAADKDGNPIGEIYCFFVHSNQGNKYRVLLGIQKEMVSGIYVEVVHPATGQLVEWKDPDVFAVFLYEKLEDFSDSVKSNFERTENFGKGEHAADIAMMMDALQALSSLEKYKDQGGAGNE